MAKIKSSDIYESDVLGGLRDSARSALTDVEKLNNVLIDLAKNLKTSVKGAKFDSSDSIKKVTESQKLSNELTKESIKLKQEEEKLRKAVAQADIATMNAKEKERIINERNAKAIQNETDAYKRLSRETRDLKNESKRLGAEMIALERIGKKNTDTYKALDKQYQSVTKDAIRFDTELKTLDARTGDHFRKVGQYENALGGLNKSYQSITRVAAGFGVALGGFEVLKGGLTTISDFQTSFADLMAVTGLNAKENQKDLDQLKNNAIEFSKEFGTSARDVVEAFKLAGSARPELLKNASALSDLTKQAIILSKASGDDVPTSIKNLTGTLNAFEGDAKDAGVVMDTLANAAQLGTQEIPYLTDAFTKFGGIAKANNVSIAESAAAVELLGKKFPDAATAGTGLRNVLLKISAPDALPKEAIERLTALGINFDVLKDKSLPFSERLDALKPLLNDNAALIKTFGSENALAAQTLIAGTKEIQLNSEAYGKQGTALEQANVKSKTLGEATARLKSQYEALFLGLEGGSEGLTGVIDFLANNLGTIVSLLGKAVVGFVAYKTALLFVNVQQQIAKKGLGGIVKGFFDLKNSAGGASGGVSKLGGALKGIGWTALISLAIELGMAIWDIASGARQAEEDLARLNKTAEKSGEAVSKNLEKLKSSLDLNIKQLDRDLKEKKITQKQYNELVKEEIKLSKQQLRDSKDKVLARRYEYKQSLRILQTLEKEINESAEKGQTERVAKLTEQQKKFLKETSEKFKIRGDEETIFGIKTGGKDIPLNYADAVAQLKSNINATGIAIRQYGEAIIDSNESLKDAESESRAYIQSTEHQTRAVKEQKKAYKDANDEIQRTTTLLKETQDLIDEVSVFEAERALDQAIENQIESINQSGQYSLDIIRQRIQAEYDLKRAIIERQYIEDVDNATNEQEVINAKIRRDFELGKLDDERVQKTKDINAQLEEAQESYAEKLKESNKEIEDSTKKTYDSQRELAKLLADYFIEQSNRRIEQIDKEIQAAQNQFDYLQKLAENGNITAQQSLSEQNKIQAEANLKKEKELKKQERIKLASSVFDTYLGKLDANSKTPVIDTIKDVTALRAFIQAIPAFKDGGVHDGGLMLVNDASGANYREIIKTPDGKTMSPTGRNVIMNAPKGTEIFTQEQWKDNMRLNDSFGQLTKTDKAGNSFDLLPLLGKLDSLEKTIQNKPDFEMDVNKLGRGIVEFTSTKRTGNSIIHNRFIAKS